MLSGPHKDARVVIASAVCFLAVACAGPKPASQAQALVDDFLAAHGQDFEACLKPMDALLPAGDRASYREAAAPGAPGARRLIVAIDASGSMGARVGGQTKMEAARAATRAFLARIPADVEVGLVAFGHRGSSGSAGKTESCSGVELVSAPGAAPISGVEARLAQLEPRGWTPLAAAITQAGAALQRENVEAGSQVVYVVSDGKETCGGDPVAAARALHEGDIKAVINIIGFDLAAADRAELAAVARAGGGVFTEARTAEALMRIAETERLAFNVRERNATTEDGFKRANANAATYYATRNAMMACFYSARNAEQAAWYKAPVAADAQVGGSPAHEEARKILFARHDAFKARAEALDQRFRAAFETNDAAIREVIDAAEKDLDAAHAPAKK